MVDHSKIRYILFSYVGDSDPVLEVDRATIALTFQSEGAEDGKLTVHTRPNWDAKYQPGDQLELAKDTLNDWEQIAPSEAQEVFQDLLDSSWGPLRPTAHGVCPISELEHLLAEKLC